MLQMLRGWYPYVPIHVHLEGWDGRVIHDVGRV